MDEVVGSPRSRTAETGEVPIAAGALDGGVGVGDGGSSLTAAEVERDTGGLDGRRLGDVDVERSALLVDS